MRYHPSLICLLRSPWARSRELVLSILALIIQKTSSEANHTSWAKQREEKKKAGTAEEDTELA